MTPKERVFACLESQKADQIPNMNIVMLLAAKELGVPYSRYCTDFRLLVEGNIRCAEKYGLSVVTTMSDSMREASALGADVEYPPDDVPYAKGLTINVPEDLLRMQPVEPSDSKRMSDSVRAVEEYRKRGGGEFAVIGWVEGAMAEAADLRGVDNLFLDCYDEPGFVKELLAVCCEQACLFAKAQIQAGADFIGVGDAVASLLGPQLYAEFALPYEIRLLQYIRDMGCRTKLHICGNITPILPQIPARLCDIIDLDWMVPLDTAREAFGEFPALSGNYDPVDVLLHGTPKKVDEAVRACIAAQPGKYICSAGCEAPKFTPEINLLQVDKTLENLKQSVSLI